MTDAEHGGGPGAARSRSSRTAPVLPAPNGSPARAVLRLPAFWTVAALLLIGAVRMGLVATEFLRQFPVATAAAVGLFILYAVPFWLFLRELDYLEREPPVLLAVAFAWGALVATSVSIPANTAVQNLTAKIGSPQLAAAWGPALAGPTVEEVSKTLGVIAIVLIARAQVNSVLDGVIYGAFVGLGFQIMENVVFALSAVAVSGQGDTVGPVVTTFLLRGFLAGLWSHTLFGALAGAGVGYLVVRTDRSRRTRVGVAVLAVLGAWCSHFLWNAPVLADGPGNGALGVLAVLLLKGLPPLLLVLLLIRAAHDREADYYANQLAALHDRELITPAELRALSSAARRGSARRHAYARVGGRGLVSVRRLQRAQARLAVALSRADAPGGWADPAVQHWQAEILRHRRKLRRLGHPEAAAPADQPNMWRRTAATAGGAALVLAVVWAAVSALGGA